MPKKKQTKKNHCLTLSEEAAILIFDSIEDSESLYHAMNGGKMFSAMIDFDNDVLRKCTKHGYLDETELTDEQYAVAEKIREKFYEYINGNGLRLFC